jgi:predicted nucleic acid-binding protein
VIRTAGAEVTARVTDAWFAALAIESGCEWITLDRDYARFPGLRWSVLRRRSEVVDASAD